MTASEATEPFDRAALQKRTVATLTGAQVLGGGAVAAAVTVGSLLAKDLTGRDYLAGMATAALTLGAAIAAVPLARQANRNGRRPTLAKALLVGAVGSLVVAVAAQAQVFVLLLVGLMAIGVAQAAGLQIRFAAADLAEDHERARAIGIVVWATTVGAVAAPNLLGPTSALAERLGVDELSGLPALGAVLNLAAGVFVWMRLRPDPLVAAGGLTAADAPKRSLAPAIQAVRAHADAVLALAAVVVAHLTMVAVMSMTSIHLDEGGQSKAFIGFVISIHIAGMYALSPVAGWLADRIGRRLTILAGAGVLVLATDTTGHTHGSESAMMLGALFLLGVGWSLCLVAGSALLSESVAPAVRVETQGLSDLAMTSAGAAAGFSAGFLKELFGYHHLSHVGMGISGALVLGATVRWWRARRAATHPASTSPDQRLECPAMALRDKLAANMAGFLEPGEQIRHVFVAQRGNPAWSLLSYWILLAKGYYAIAWTDRGIVVCRTSGLSMAKVKGFHQRLSHQRLGDDTGKMFRKIQIGDENAWIHRRFWKDLDACNASLGPAAPPMPPS